MIYHPRARRWALRRPTESGKRDELRIWACRPFCKDVCSGLGHSGRRISPGDEPTTTVGPACRATAARTVRPVGLPFAGPREVARSLGLGNYLLARASYDRIYPQHVLSGTSEGSRTDDDRTSAGTPIFDAGRIGSATVAVGPSFGGTRRMMPNPALTDSFASHYQSWR